MRPKKKQMVFYCFLVQWTVRAGSIFGYGDGGGGGWSHFAEKKVKKFASEAHVVTPLAFLSETLQHQTAQQKHL